MLVIQNDTRALRNRDGIALKVPKCNRKTLGGNAFSTVAPKLWNQLPTELRSTKSEHFFRNNTKTILFKRHYNL